MRLEWAVCECDSLPQSGLTELEMFLLLFPFSEPISLFSLCCRTPCLISHWHLKAKRSVQGLPLHLSLRSDLPWCPWIPEHLSPGEALLSPRRLLLLHTDHVNVSQYETLAFHALPCQVRNFCHRLFQRDERKCVCNLSRQRVTTRVEHVDLFAHASQFS